MREIYVLGVLVEARLRELAPKVLFFRSQADDTSHGYGRELFAGMRRNVLGAEDGACTWL